ncbi:MAG: NAD-dependent epimerase/dehydratase family protein [Planctomycetes bacterium]|nr:NAD-dependent epimerase/dehydratase family protein [Planctomycetota bacterium]
MHVLVLGGSGTISTHLVRHLVAMGRTVTVLNRGKSQPPPPAGVEQLIADRHDAAVLSAALKGRSFDATVDMLCFNPDQARMLTEALPRHGHLVFCSTVCALGTRWTSFPVSEDATPAPEPTFGYGVEKAAAEAWFTAYAQRSGGALTIVRPSTTFDQRMGVLRQICWDGAAWLARVRAGKPIVVCDSGLGIHQFMHADDGGRGFALIAGNAKTHGRIYHLVGPSVTWAEQHRTAMRVVGREVPLVGVPSAILDRTTIPGDGVRKDIFGFHGHFAETRLAADTGFRPAITLHEAIARTVATLDAEGRITRAADESWEDALIDRWGSAKI